MSIELNVWFSEFSKKDENNYAPIGVYFTREQAQEACQRKLNHMSNYYHMDSEKLNFNKLPKKYPVWCAVTSTSFEFFVIPVKVGEDIQIDGENGFLVGA